jgi:RHS repeat-associated protein
MSAGSGDYAISWKPNFRFPGQYQDDDMGLSATGASLFVQNHYREYMPGLGRYNRADPVLKSKVIYAYPNNPIISIDGLGLAEYRGTCVYTSGGAVGGLGYLSCKVLGICKVNHKQQLGDLKAFFSGLTVGLPLSITGFNIDQFDDLSGAGDIYNMGGSCNLVSVSFSAGIGRYLYTLQLGNTISSSDEFGLAQDGPEAGIDFSFDFFTGFSWLTNVKETCCRNPGSFY